MSRKGILATVNGSTSVPLMNVDNSLEQNPAYINYVAYPKRRHLQVRLRQ